MNNFSAVHSFSAVSRFLAVHSSARLMAAAGMLCLSLTTHAVELTGTPVPVGKPVVKEAATASTPASKPVVTSAAASSSSVARSAQAAVSTLKAQVNAAASASSTMAKDALEGSAGVVAEDAHEDADESVNEATSEESSPATTVDASSDNNPFDDGHMFERHSNWDSPDLLVPVVAMGLLFGGPVILVIVLSFFYYRAKSQRQQNLNANIDKLLAAGRDIPIELLLGEEVPTARSAAGFGVGQVSYSGSEAMMHKGVRNIGLGTGWLLFLTIMFNFKIGSFGFIFIGLGLSQVVIWYLSGARRNGAVKVED